MIFIIEGADGTGKSTLAKTLAKEVGATILHCGFDTRWDIHEYHGKMFNIAQDLEKICGHVILDRWAPSEFVYGNVFRGGESYDTQSLIIECVDSGSDIRLILCRNDNAKENHKKNIQHRYEMYGDMEKVSYYFDRYFGELGLPFYEFDFDKKSTKEFLKEVTSGKTA